MSIYIGHSAFMNKIKGLKSTCAGLDLLDNMSVDSLAITLGTPHNIHVVAREPDLSERQITLRSCHLHLGRPQVNLFLGCEDRLARDPLVFSGLLFQPDTQIWFCSNPKYLGSI